MSKRQLSIRNFFNPQLLWNSSASNELEVQEHRPNSSVDKSHDTTYIAIDYEYDASQESHNDNEVSSIDEDEKLDVGDMIKQDCLT
eukprot:scaffold395_cov265-Chaetoceros_neogracile.AAC.17